MRSSVRVAAAAGIGLLMVSLVALVSLPVEAQAATTCGQNGPPFCSADDTLNVPTLQRGGQNVVTTDDPRLPTQAENDALQGTSGAPSTTNRYVTNNDPRLAGSSVQHGHPTNCSTGVTTATVNQGCFDNGGDGGTLRFWGCRSPGDGGSVTTCDLPSEWDLLPAGEGGGGGGGSDPIVFTISGMSGPTATQVGAIPAGAIVIALFTEVATAVTGTAGFTGFLIGDSVAGPNGWGEATTLTVGGQTNGTHIRVAHTALVYRQATDLVLTAVGGDFLTGAVTVTIHYTTGPIGGGGGGGGGSGITSLNGQTGASQTMTFGVAGAGPNVSSVGNVHTFNLPDTADSARGLVSLVPQVMGAGLKTFPDGIAVQDRLDIPAVNALPGTCAANQIVRLLTAPTGCQVHLCEGTNTWVQQGCSGGGGGGGGNDPRFPSMTGNGDRLMRVNSAGTGAEYIESMWENTFVSATDLTVDPVPGGCLEPVAERHPATGPKEAVIKGCPTGSSGPNATIIYAFRPPANPTSGFGKAWAGQLAGVASIRVTLHAFDPGPATPSGTLAFSWSGTCYSPGTDPRPALNTTGAQTTSVSFAIAQRPERNQSAGIVLNGAPCIAGDWVVLWGRGLTTTTNVEHRIPGINVEFATIVRP